MIDFYLTKEPTYETCYSLVCKLVDKAYQQKRSVYIHTENQKTAQQLDDLIWIFRDDAFIPHSLFSKSDSNIQIGYKGIVPQNFNDILINITAEVPEFFKQFQRILEIIPEELKTLGRQKFRFYRDKQCEITTHDLSKN